MVALVFWGVGYFLPEVAGFDGFDVAGEFGVFFGVADGELCAGDGEAGFLKFPTVEGDSREDEGGGGGIEIFAEGGDEAGEILFVTAGVDGILVLVALPEDESGDFVALAFIVWVDFGEVFQCGFGIGNVIVVLFAGVPVDDFFRLTFDPRVRGVLVSGVGFPSAAYRSLPGGRRSQPRERLPMQDFRMRTGSSSRLPITCPNPSSGPMERPLDVAVRGGRVWYGHRSNRRLCGWSRWLYRRWETGISFRFW